MIRHSILSRAALAALALTLLPGGDSRAQGGDDGWNWTVAPYLWLPSISGDTSFPDRGGGDGVEVDAGDILDNLEFAALLRVSATSEDWRFLSDGAYIGLGKRSKGDNADIDLDALYVEVAGAWRPNEHVDLLAGVRYWDFGFEIDIDDPLRTDVDRDQDWFDPIVGVRFIAPMGDSWEFMARGDVGGFGVGCDFTWNAELLFAWNATDRFTLAFGYRHLAIEETFEDAVDDVDIDLALSGPEIGFAFRF